MRDETIFDRATAAVRHALTRPDAIVPLMSVGDVPAALAALQRATDTVNNAENLPDWLARAEDYGDSLRQAAAAAFAAPPNPADQLFVHSVRQNLPRLAALLVLARVFRTDPETRRSIVDWKRLRDLVTDPESVVNEDMWDSLLSDLGLAGPGGRMPAVLAGLVLLAPKTVLAIANDNLKIAPLAPPPTRSAGLWRDFRNATGDWISITVPAGDPVAQRPVPGNILDLVSGLTPDLSGTLGVRSRRSVDSIGPRTDMEFWLALAAERDQWVWAFDDGWRLKVEPGITGGFGRVERKWHGAFRPFVVDPAKLPGPSDPVAVTFGRDVPPGKPDLLLGAPYDTRIVLKDFLAFLYLREDSPIIEAGVKLDGFAVVLTNRWFRVFGISEENLRDGLRFDADFAIAFVEGVGLRLNLAAGLDAVIVFPDGKVRVGSDALNLTLHGIRLRIPVEADQNNIRARLEITFHVSGQLGPVLIVMDGAGAWLGWWKEPLNNLNQATKFRAGLLPPTGIGVEVKAGPITGGGFLDFRGGPRDRYAGVLNIRVFTFGVTAFGIHEKTESGRTSFVMVLGVLLPFPGIQLGFGFALSGIGGLLGIHRRADTDALRERLTSGAAGNLLFPPDPIRDAPLILDDLGALFPARDGVHVGGPMFRVSWLAFVSLDLAVIIELPGPSKILLLGSLRAELAGPTKEKPLLHLRLDIVGLIDFAEKMVEFDATLVRSTALEVFHLTGDAAFRLSYGPRPYTLLSIGGFYPGFNPEPAVVPDLTRVALTQTPAFFGTGLHLRAEAYFAFTSNTLQLGAAAEVGMAAGPINAVGFIAFDALIQFHPFHFTVRFSAGFRVRWRRFTLAGVRVEGILDGPGPIMLTGRLCFEVLWFDVCWGHTFRIGDAEPDRVEPVGSAVSALSSELDAPDNLQPTGGDDGLVVLRSDPGVGRPPVNPQGKLAWRQKRAPLNVPLDRFEGVRLARSQAVVAECPQASGVVNEWFSPGSFVTLSDAEALNRAAFEPLQAGVEVGFPTVTSAEVAHTVEVQVFRLPQIDPLRIKLVGFPTFIVEAVDGRQGSVGVRLAAPVVAVHDEAWMVRRTNGVVRNASLTQTDAFQRARSSRAVAVPSRDVVHMEAF